LIEICHTAARRWGVAGARGEQNTPFCVRFTFFISIINTQKLFSLIIYLCAYSAAQKTITKQARATRETEQTKDKEKTTSIIEIIIIQSVQSRQP
jgi:hypothetical protein